MPKRKAFITGITGQDGSYLAEILLEKDYEVYGMIRRSSSFNTARIDHIFGELNLVFGDLADGSSLNQLLRTFRPDEVYNLGAQSHVKCRASTSPSTPPTSPRSARLRLLDAIREEDVRCRFYEAGSSEMFGQVRETPQSETTPFHPRSPYGVGKVFGYWITRNYREAYGLFAVNGILFNHESPRRGPTFVTRKITRASARILRGRAGRAAARQPRREARLGLRARLHGRRLADAPGRTSPTTTSSRPDETHSVREFLDEAFGYAGLDWHEYVKIDERYFRPAEVDVLLGDASKAREKLGWEPSVRFQELVRIMVDHDRERRQTEEHYV